MANHPTLNTELMIGLEQRDLNRLRAIPLDERGYLIIAACRAAVEIEESRMRMGLDPARPAPWPESTWNFLAEAARRVREG